MSSLYDQLRAKEDPLRDAALAEIERQREMPPTADPNAPAGRRFDPKLYYQQLNDAMSPGERFATMYDRGVTRMGEVLWDGRKEAPQVKAAADDARDRYTSAVAGDIVGTTAPLLLAARTGNIAGALPRFLATTAVAGGEGALVAQAENANLIDTAKAGGTAALLGAGMELVLPHVARLGRKVFSALNRKAPTNLITREGGPTPEFQSALDDAGISFDALTAQAVDSLRRQGDLNPSQAARQARFDAQGIPYTQGDITQDFAQQTAEQRLLNMTTTDDAIPLRQAKQDQSLAFSNAVNRTADGFGSASSAGERTKGALMGREQSLRSQKNNLYTQAGELARGMGAQLDTSSLSAALPDAQTMRRLGRLEGSQIKALNDLLVEFGIDQSDEAVKAFTKRGEVITPLSFENFEDFRQGLNQITRSDRTGAATVATAPVVDALDALVEQAAENLPPGIAAPKVLETLKKARSIVGQLKTEFSSESLAGRLIATGKDGMPKVEPSQVLRRMYTEPPERIQRTLSILAQSGEKGVAAIGDLKAAVVLDALEASLKAPSRKDAGIELVGGFQFAKHLEQKLGPEKLSLLFKGDEAGLNRVMALAQTGKDMMPPAGATVKGSGQQILDMLKVAGNLPVVAAVIRPLEMFVTAGRDARQVRAALRANPEAIKATEEAIQKLGASYPALASSLAALIHAEDSDD